MECMMEDRTASEREGFEPFGHPQPGTGVYLLLFKGTVLYVGKSLNVYHRIGQHISGMRRYKKGLRPAKGKEEVPLIEFDQIKVKWVPIWQLDAEEIKLIQRYLPEKNTLMNRTFIDVSDLPKVAKLIADAPRVTSLLHGNTLGSVRRRAA
jgi:hypothetical protein